MSATEKKFTRRLITRVARYEMLEARADGRLKSRIPLKLATKELKRALRERRKMARKLAAMGALERKVAEAQASLRGESGVLSPVVDAQYEVSQ
jgi:DNA invertase Pin-like site-specific DNA recombinase